jgi:hypothetical protein
VSRFVAPRASSAAASLRPAADGDATFHRHDAAATGYNGQIDPERKYFLVRALHGSRGTGYYRVRRRGEDLAVSHSSLGSCVVMNKSALLLALDFTPRTVHVAMSVAK